MASITNTILPGVKLIKSPVYHDNRGYFSELFREQDYLGMALNADLKSEPSLGNKAYSHTDTHATNNTSDDIGLLNDDHYPVYPLVQFNHSHSVHGVLRGLHFQKKYPQGKLISVIQGHIFDVVADINPKSPYFGKYFSIELKAMQGTQLWIPPGYAHGFCVLSQSADIVYQCSDYYHPDDEAGISWDCPVLAINWPLKQLTKQQPILSNKDTQWPSLDKYYGP